MSSLRYCHRCDALTERTACRHCLVCQVRKTQQRRTDPAVRLAEAQRDTLRRQRAQVERTRRSLEDL